MNERQWLVDRIVMAELIGIPEFPQYRATRACLDAVNDGWQPSSPAEWRRIRRAVQTIESDSVADDLRTLVAVALSSVMIALTITLTVVVRAIPVLPDHPVWAVISYLMLSFVLAVPIFIVARRLLRTMHDNAVDRADLILASELPKYITLAAVPLEMQWWQGLPRATTVFALVTGLPIAVAGVLAGVLATAGVSVFMLCWGVLVAAWCFACVKANKYFEMRAVEAQHRESYYDFINDGPDIERLP